MADLLGGIFNALISAFGIVTLIFALNERFNPQAPESGKAAAGKWQPSQLPARPASGLQIKWGDPIAAIVFLVIFLVIINLNLDLIGLYLADGESLRIVPLLSDYFRQFIPWISLSLVLAILIEGVKLFTGRWTIPLVIGSLAQKTLSLIISLQLFADARLFSADFISEMQLIFFSADKTLAADFAVQTCRVLRIIAIAGFVIDVLTLGWKTIRIAMIKADKPIKFTEV
ncbi:MAG TPA: hypothetical protein DD640_10120 [Clostridiales bacterium]|nr:hypothetical protein [Clostridiales bacterium]